MTTSGSFSFDQQCDDIISDALVNVGALGPGKTATGNMRAHAFRALNRLVKEIDSDGDFLWRTARTNVSILAGTATYTLPTGVLALEDPADFLASGATARIQVFAQSNADFRKIADRTSRGTPLNYLVEKTLAGGLTITLWPVPDTAGTLEVMAAFKAQDYVIGSDTSDFPSGWVGCLVDGLSWKLAPAYGQDGSGFRDDHMTSRRALLDADNERAPLTLVPFGSSY